MKLDETFLTELRGLGTLIHAKKHDCLYNRAHRDNYVYCLEEGLCALHSVSASGKERIYQYFLPGDFIGFIPAYRPYYPDDTFYAFSITAKSDCSLYQIPYQVFIDFMDANPEFYRNLFEVTVTHYDNALKHCYTLQDGDNFISLCQALIELADYTTTKYRIHKDFSYSEIASYLGIHTITVTRMMGRLKEMGIIAKSGHFTIVLDMDRLTRISRGEV